MADSETKSGWVVSGGGTNPAMWRGYAAMIFFLMSAAGIISLLLYADFFYIVNFTDSFDTPTGMSSFLWSGLVLSPIGVVGMELCGRSAVRRGRVMEIPGLDEVVGDLPHPDLSDAVPVDEVWGKLERLNGLDVPYTVVRREGKRGGTQLVVRWRAEDVHWRSVLGIGGEKKSWVMRVKLHGNGTYGFYETTSSRDYDLSLDHAGFSWSLFVGKNLGMLLVTRVYAPNLRDGEGNSLGDSAKLDISSDDAKVPVFRILRAYGWRPRFNNWMNQLCEY